MKLKQNSKNSKVYKAHTIYVTWNIVWYFTCYVKRRLDETIFVMYFSFVTLLDETCSQGKLLSIHQGHTYIDDLLNYKGFPTRLILSSTTSQQNSWQLLSFCTFSKLWLFNYLNFLFIDLIFEDSNTKIVLWKIKDFLLHQNFNTICKLLFLYNFIHI